MDTHAKSANALAKALRLSPSRIGDIVLERRDVTAERRSAVRLIKVKRSSARPRSWTHSTCGCGTRWRSNLAAVSRGAGIMMANSRAQRAPTFPRKRVLTMILDVLCILLIYNDYIFGIGTAGTRTQDQSLKRALLYQLSYRPNEPRIIAELRPQITGNSLKRTGSDRVRRRRQSRPPEGGRSRISRRRRLPGRPDSRTRSC
jgi:hypothetical protein